MERNSIKSLELKLVAGIFYMHMLLDVNIDVYHVYMGKKFTIALAPTLNLDSTQDTGYFI